MTTEKKTNPPTTTQERIALERFGCRITRTVIAVFHARRSAKQKEFFVAPQIAEYHELNPKDLNWALGRLEGQLIETLEARRGRFRRIRLMPEFEYSATGDELADETTDEEKVTIDIADVMSRLKS